MNDDEKWMWLIIVEILITINELYKNDGLIFIHIWMWAF
jgi:hypothetical protein